MKEYKPEELNLPENLREETPIHSKVDIEQIVFRQMLLTNQAASQDESIFAANVRVLLSFLPNQKKQEVKERSAEYTSTNQSWQYKNFCGVPLGTPEEPINGSPCLLTEDVTDWHQLYEIILYTFETLGITWKTDTFTVEAMKALEDKPLPEPTPVFNGATPEQPETEKQAQVQHCKV